MGDGGAFRNIMSKQDDDEEEHPYSHVACCQVVNNKTECSRVQRVRVRGLKSLVRIFRDVFGDWLT
jgi:hypothetical protein